MTRKILKEIEALTEKIRLEPKNIAHYIQRASCYEALGNINNCYQAMLDYDKAAKVLIKECEKRANERKEKEEQALYDAKKAEERAKITPKEQKILEEKALKDIEILTKKIELEPENFQYYMARGDAYNVLGDRKNYVKDYECANCYLYLKGFEKISTENSSKDDATGLQSQKINFEEEVSNPKATIEKKLPKKTLSEQEEKHLKEIEDLTAKIASEPNHALHYANRGKVYYALIGIDEKDYVSHAYKAFQDYSKAIELDPDNLSYYWERAKACICCNRYEIALQDCERAFELVSDQAKFYEVRAKASYGLGKYDAAINEYDKAISLDPKNPKYHIGRGHALYEADYWYFRCLYIESYSKAIELDPNNPEYYIIRGEAYEKNVYEDKALKDYSKAIELDPSNDKYYYMRLHLYHQLGKQKEMLDDYTRIIELNPSVSVYEARGDHNYHLKRYQEALDDYNQCFLLADKNTNRMSIYYQNRAMAYQALGRHEEALKDYDKAISIWQESHEFYNGRGEVLYSLNRYEEAFDECHLALLLLTKSKLKERDRENNSLRLLDYDRDEGTYYHNRAKILFALHRFEEALDDATQAILILKKLAKNMYRGEEILRPTLAMYYMHRGKIYYALRRNNDASKEYKQAALLATSKKVRRVYQKQKEEDKKKVRFYFKK